MPYIVETCGPDGWQQRAVRPTKTDAYAVLDELIQTEHWGTLSIRVQPTGLTVVTPPQK